MLKRFFQNTCKPKGTAGKLMIHMMNKGHMSLSQWGFSHLSLNDCQSALDIGCGGGANLTSLLNRFPQGMVTGMDYSPLCVEQSSHKNQAFIESGRCRVLQGDASSLPFEPDSFDLVTAVETIYFWPGLPSCFRQVLTVLRPGGLFLICNEACNPEDDRWSKIIDGMTVYSGSQLEQYLQEAGFSSIQCDEDRRKGRICLIAEKKR